MKSTPTVQRHKTIKKRINSCNPKTTHELGLGLCFEASGFNILLKPTILVFNNKNKLPNDK